MDVSLAGGARFAGDLIAADVKTLSGQVSLS
jgi:hypothetical protein